MNAFSRLAIALALTAAGSVVCAQETARPGQAGHQAATSVELTDGEVRKIDREAGKITLRHGELKNLGMPPMSMVFRVKDAAMLDQAKVGDKVRFAAERVNGAVTVVQLRAAQ
jgi:Cu/Ag efflux protein CusF